MDAAISERRADCTIMPLSRGSILFSAHGVPSPPQVSHFRDSLVLFRLHFLDREKTSHRIVYPDIDRAEFCSTARPPFPWHRVGDLGRQNNALPTCGFNLAFRALDPWTPRASKPTLAPCFRLAGDRAPSPPRRR